MPCEGGSRPRVITGPSLSPMIAAQYKRTAATRFRSGKSRSRRPPTDQPSRLSRHGPDRLATVQIAGRVRSTTLDDGTPTRYGLHGAALLSTSRAAATTHDRPIRSR